VSTFPPSRETLWARPMYTNALNMSQRAANVATNGVREGGKESTDTAFYSAKKLGSR